MKIRLDKLLVQKQYFLTRSKAQKHIMAGYVLVNNRTERKTGVLTDINANIRIKNKEKYVGKGGYKLEKAINTFKINPSKLNVIDIGASTGGFTDCLLQHNAAFVYAIDVGTNQIAYKLRMDKRVAVLDKINAKNISNSLFNKPLNLAVIDLSFISITKVLPPTLSVLYNKKIIALIKPQFEIGKNIPSFKGIVKNPKDHIKAIEKIIAFAKNINLYTKNITYSPIKGAKGNIEFLVYLEEKPNKQLPDYKAIVYEAHNTL